MQRMNISDKENTWKSREEEIKFADLIEKKCHFCAVNASEILTKEIFKAKSAK